MADKGLLESAWKSGISYSEYRQMIDLLRENNKTTGSNHSEDFLHYTDLNIARMNKWDKRFEINVEVEKLLRELDHEEKWLVITEAWCGDAAHTVPMLNKMAEVSPQLSLKIVLRDENLPLMDQYLTNGGRSIPKLIRLTKSFEEIGTWGPRPEKAQDLMVEMKSADLPKADINKALQLWYARDKGATLQEEWAGLLL